jgi:hypothetical protein
MERDLQSQHHLRMVPADGRYCDALLAEGFERARASGATGVGEYPAYRTRLTMAAPPARDPSFVAHAFATEPSVEGLVERGKELLELPEFASWVLERPTLAPYLGEITAAKESPLILSRPQQEERVHAAMTRALRELFAGPGADAYRRRLEEMAYYLHATGRHDPGRIALATSRALATSARGGEGIRFFEEQARRSIAMHVAEDDARAKAEAEQSVLVRPGSPGTQPRR